ncbi:MAG: carboxymuconolactone decarboxylase family protein [Sutterellaceae bacterium]|nr:carboxymuconolactone decarboxylase family protein [Sutterellaceae bacterium]
MQRRDIAKMGLAAAATAIGTTSVMAQNKMTQETELTQILSRLTDRDVPAMVKMPVKTQWLVRLTTLTALGDTAVLPDYFLQASKAGLSTDEMQEAVMQTMAYVGIPIARRAELILLDVVKANNLPAPKPQGTVDDKTRFDDGLKAQTGIFGDAILTMHKNARAEERRIMVDLLTGFCFGDTYTRKTLSLKMRDFLTFVTIAALGGCDPQVKSHVGGNLNMGTTREELIEALVVMAGLIGFPKTLNALAAVNAVALKK